jgi:myo-inositol-1(or 4)-monophosphatase
MNLSIAKRVAESIKKEVWGSVMQRDLGEEVYIGADEDVTYRLDDIAEKAALETLKGEPVAVLSEEAGFLFLDESPDYICVIDPVDGSTNAILGVPFYCTSVALAPWSENVSLQDVNVCVVMNLVTGDTFEAKKGKGARLNGKAICPTSKTVLDEAVGSLYLNSDYRIISAFSKVRAMGAVALELAYIASGGLDCLVDDRSRLKVTDVAAGKILIEEAGGKITDIGGNDLNHSITRLERVSVIAAGNQKLHANILREVRRR